MKLFNLYRTKTEEVVPAPSFGVRVSVEILIAKNLSYEDALERAGEEALHFGSKCLIREV